MEKDNKKKMPIGLDLVGSLFTAGFGYIFGRMGSWVHPLGVPKAIKNIRDGEIQDLNDFTYIAAGAIGYGVGYYNIVKDIMENPSDAINYVPVVLNAVSLGIEASKLLFNKGKREGLEAKALEA